MSSTPDVSVVMSVYNGAANLAATLDSVLGQEGCALELVVVDDGSTDGSGRILDSYAAADPRVKVIHQENAGLTRALIRGCAEATGQYIARQDADDISLPGRLKEQCEFLRAHPEAVLVASTIRFVAPAGEWMFDVMPEDPITIELDIARLRIPSLVATCFRRDAYLRAGGFRPTFSVAQDTDLWLRLVELGPCRGLAQAHYQATMTAGGITSHRRAEQVRLASLAIDCARARRLGQDDSALLAAYVPPPRRGGAATATRAGFHYYVASCLRQHDRQAARRYLRLVLRENPFHVKALVRFLLG
jgi:glycosyltransferase involved in cell wall biosynthesis